MRIIVVDDDLRIRQMTAEALRDQGHDVAEAESGAAALCLLCGETELLLTDVQMPGMTGPELADAAQERFPALQIRFMSADTGNIPEAAFRGRDVLAKPFTLAALMDAVPEG